LKNHTIALFDILGFSQLVEENPLESVVESTLGWFRKALHHSVVKGEFPSETPAFSELERQGLLVFRTCATGQWIEVPLPVNPY